MSHKLKVAIFDLTDCEGCEVQLLSMVEKILDFTKCLDILNWRLIKGKNKLDSYDITFIEGTVLTSAEEKIIKKLRENSKIIVALGACACIGGVATLKNSIDRKKMVQYVYGNKYKPLAENAKPLSAYIKIDYFFNGCPVNPEEISRWLAELVIGKLIKANPYPVCFQCKEKENKCLLLAGQPCLGPITLGGCGAACTSQGIRCYGCWGPCREANFPALITVLKNQGRKPAEIKKILSIFFTETEEFKNII